MRELVESIAKALVDHPDDVQVRSVEGEQVTVLELRVHPEDLGKVIGRSGRVAQALRTVVRATAEGRVSVDILDSEEAAEGLDDDSSADLRQAADDASE